ncbi:SDR family oxidoreductase [Ramlibacter tataouinensis]|uniref:SDR family oxidoreductase n=1 Tax=Ramlibacter tataouinensis TaxID=94132 RepID=UPI0022F3E225|nr:SDR family oxidoreductase [Ramlibacter tataouinensis]WBY00253.1 SDR family oxidoreductase [Ramlibacter tataouinensis]
MLTGPRPIAGSVALVTGAAGGIGAWIVTELLRRGAARVYAAGRRMPAAAHPRVVPLSLDITDPAQVAAAARAAEDVTLLVNNAGVNRNQRLLHAADPMAARDEMETNYFGTLAMCRAFAPVLARNGGGAIANVLSIAARVGMPAMGSLSASKAAALRLTECVRAELAPQGTLVVAFLPSAVDTAMTRGLAIPKGRPEDAAAALLDGIERGQEDLSFGDGAARIEQMLAKDPQALARELAAPLAR